MSKYDILVKTINVSNTKNKTPISVERISPTLGYFKYTAPSYFGKRERENCFCLCTICAPDCFSQNIFVCSVYMDELEFESSVKLQTIFRLNI